jgi:hypothetical protein
VARAQRPGRLSRTDRAATWARRLWPYVLMAWERWQKLTPEEKERYKARARGYAARGRRTLDRRRRRP